MRSIFMLGRLYRIYFYLCLVGTALPLYPLFLLYLKRGKLESAHRMRRRWARYVLWITGLRVRIQGAWPTERGVPFVIVPNHSSYLDIILLIAKCPYRFAFMAKEELTKVPLMGIIFKTLDIPVPRGNTLGAARAYKKGLMALEKGISLVFFAEGGITPPPDKVKALKAGAFLTSNQSAKSIIPITILGTARALPEEGPKARPGRITLLLHPVMTPPLAPDVALVVRELLQEGVSLYYGNQ